MLVAIAVPVTQLRTSIVVKACCCPDPSNCHCPPDKHHDDHGASLNACHHVDHVVVSAQAPSFTSPIAIALPDPTLELVAIELAPHEPHPAPDPNRPAAPS